MRQKNILLLVIPVFCCFMMRSIGGKANVLAPGQITDTVNPFVAISDVDFYCKERQFPLPFTTDKEGNATQVLAFKSDLWKKVKE